MNDVLLVALVASIAPTITAGGALYVIVRNDLRTSIERAQARAAAATAAEELSKKIDINAIKVDGRLSELLKSTKLEAHAAGMVEGAAVETAAQGKRDEAAVAKIEEAKQQMPDNPPARTNGLLDITTLNTEKIIVKTVVEEEKKK